MAQQKIVVGCPGCGSAMRVVPEEEAQAHKWKRVKVDGTPILYVYCPYDYCRWFEQIVRVVESGFVWAGRLWNDGGER